ncbi:MAG TPA: peptidoglycan DD-metalloendopeptidase family protein [Candidatus Paceibacterota bacterium]
MLFVILGIPLGLFFFSAPHSQAQTATSTLQTQIDQTNAQIKQLQDDIAKLQSQLTTTTAQKQTLQNAVAALNLNIQKLQKSITLAEAQIKQKDSQITTISITISTTTSQIGDTQSEVADSLRQLASLDNESLIAVLLSGGTLSDFFDQSAALASVRTGLENKIEELNSLTHTLKTNETTAEAQKAQLATYQQNLTEQQQGLAISKDSQTKLLTQTKNQESAYQQLLKTKQDQETAFESTLSDLQSQLAPIKSGTVPKVGNGILSWPFSASVMATCPAKSKYLNPPNNDCITQFFGNTSFSTANPQIYNNMGHDGVDIAIPIGTPVEAALGGVVLATGNTDIKAPNGQMCYSFGKWVMLQHPNGLDTLYAHLSNNTVVSKGQGVTTGQLIGYSGMTGYATGPHLHFGVYASSGVQIMDLGQWRGSTGTPCTSAGAILPVAPTNAYLNPLSYLPSI